MIEFLFEHSGVAMGILIAAAGILMWFFPQLTAGYYTVSAEHRDRVDWRGLRRFLLIGFVSLGTALAGLDLAIRNEGVSYAVRIAVAFIGVIGLTAAGQRFGRRK